MAKMYAWSNFPVEWNDYGQVTKMIKAGESISQSDIGVSDEDWEGLIETGAVSEEEYPDVPAGVSPAEYQAQQENAAIQVQEAAQLVQDVRGEGDEEAAPRTQPPTATTREATTGNKDK